MSSSTGGGGKGSSPESSLRQKFRSATYRAEKDGSVLVRRLGDNGGVERWPVRSCCTGCIEKLVDCLTETSVEEGDVWIWSKKGKDDTAAFDALHVYGSDRIRFVKVEEEGKNDALFDFNKIREFLGEYETYDLEKFTHVDLVVVLPSKGSAGLYNNSLLGTKGAPVSGDDQHHFRYRDFYGNFWGDRYASIRYATVVGDDDQEEEANGAAAAAVKATDA